MKYASELIRNRKQSSAIWEITVEPIRWIDAGGVGVTLPVGTQYKSYTTRNFGVVVLHRDTKTINKILLV